MTVHEGSLGMWMQGPTYSQPTALERRRVAGPMLGRLYSRGKPQYSLYMRLNEPQDQSEHEGVKQNLHSSDTRDRTQAVQLVAKRLNA